MALINSIGAGIHTTLEYIVDTSGDGYVLPTTSGEHQTDIASGGDFETLTEVTNVRDFPSFGTPANIINVPAYGQNQSSQVSGQADSPTLEFTLNYVPNVHSTIQGLVNDGNRYVFRLTIKNSDSSTADDAVFYIKGSVASFSVAPNLTDSNQATLTLATEGDYVGPFASA